MSTGHTSADVLDALARLWPDDRYLHLREAPLTADRLGTKADLVVIALWASKRYEIDVVEVKVSLGDFKREIERRTWIVRAADGREVAQPRTQAEATNLIESKARIDSGTPQLVEPARYVGMRHGDELPGPWSIDRQIDECVWKSDPWRQHAHRFHIAVPAPLAPKIIDILPNGWGLIACADGRSQVVVTAAKNRDATPFGWRSCIGMMRAAADSGPQALSRAFDRGAAEAWKRAGQPAGTLNTYLLAGRPLR